MRATLLALLPLLSACVDSAPAPHVQDRLAVSLVEAQHSFGYAAGSGRLSDGERSRMAAFLRPLQVVPGDTILITLPASGSAAVDAARRANIRGALSMLPARIELRTVETFQTRPVHSQTGLLRVVRASGLRATCAPGLLIDDPGCATASNLAAMIVTPGDALNPDSLGLRHDAAPDQGS